MSLFYCAETYKAQTSIGYLVRRAGTLMTARVEAAFAEHEITFAQWLVLMNLRDGLATTAAEIARDMCHDSGALTRVIDQLLQRGLVTRTRSLADRRTLELTLTEAGLHMVNSLVPLVVGMLNTALAGFTPDEAETLTRLLTKLVAADSNFSEAGAAQPEPLS
jgi:DNA-binding MarR family transcriptional regulator